jgi:hypothetical protein
MRHYAAIAEPLEVLIRRHGLLHSGRARRDGSRIYTVGDVARGWRNTPAGMLVTPDDVKGERVLIAPLAGGAGMAMVERFIGTDTPPGTVGASVLPRFIDLPRDFNYAGIMLRHSGTLTAAGGVANGVLVDDNPMEFIQRVVLEGTGGGSALQLKNLRARQNYRAEHLLLGQEPNAVPILSAGIQTGTAWSFIHTLWNVLIGAQVPPEIAVQSILDPREYGKLTLEIDYGLTTDFINGGDRVITIPTASTDIYALQPINVTLAKNRPYRYIETLFLQDQTASITAERRLSNPIPVGRPIRYILEQTRDETVNKRQPIDDTVGATKVFISQTLLTRYNNFREIAGRNRAENRVALAVNPAGLNPLGSRDNPAVGWYMFDFAKGGRLDGVLDASRFPARGVPIDFLQDIATASTRQLYISLGYLVPGGAR